MAGSHVNKQHPGRFQSSFRDLIKRMAHTLDMASAPLLTDNDCPDFKGNEEILELQESQPRFSFSEVVVELKLLFTIALPLIITGLLNYGKSFVSMFSSGQFSEKVLAAGTLAITMANVTGYSIISGLSLGMDPITSQSFGANQWDLMAHTLVRTIIVLLVACIPVSILWLVVEPVLILFQQDHFISAIAATYLAFCIPVLLFQALINPIKIYLKCQKITAPLMISAFLGLLMHILVNYLFWKHTKLGIKGIACAVVLTDFVVLAALMVYIFCWGISWNSYPTGIWASSQEWKSLLHLAMSSCFTVCLEWWWYELMMLISGVLKDGGIGLAAMGVIIQATALFYIFPHSLGQAAATRVGHELGAGRADRARLSACVAMGCAVLMSLISATLMVMLRDVWGHVFTIDEAVAKLAASVMPVVGLCELGNCPQTTGCGVLRGTAQSKLAVRINFLSFYLVGLPVALVLFFCKGMGVKGLMVGLLCAQAVCVILMSWALWKTDWEEEARRAKDLIGGQPQPQPQG